MNDLLLDLAAHNVWATRTLLDACSSLTDEQLAASIPGSYGSLRDTFAHFVIAEGWYLKHLTGIMPEADVEYASLSLEDVRERVDRLQPTWQKLLSEPIDHARWIQADGDEGGRFEFTAGVVIVQIFNHANEHREQICAIMTEIGIQPPDIDGWHYSMYNGLGRQVSS